jgi:hypothetical protein
MTAPREQGRRNGSAGPRTASLLITHSYEKGEFVFYLFALAACALLSAILAIALVREVRLRRALALLLRRILTTWRRFHGPRQLDPERPPDVDDRPGDRL